MSAWKSQWAKRSLGEPNQSRASRNERVAVTDWARGRAWVGQKEPEWARASQSAPEWARESFAHKYKSSQVQVQSLKRSCKMQFRHMDLLSKGPSTQKLWTNLTLAENAYLFNFSEMNLWYYQSDISQAQKGKHKKFLFGSFSVWYSSIIPNWNQITFVTNKDV